MQAIYDAPERRAGFESYEDLDKGTQKEEAPIACAYAPPERMRRGKRRERKGLFSRILKKPSGRDCTVARKNWQNSQILYIKFVHCAVDDAFGPCYFRIARFLIDMDCRLQVAVGFQIHTLIAHFPGAVFNVRDHTMAKPLPFSGIRQVELLQFTAVVVKFSEANAANECAVLQEYIVRTAVRRIKLTQMVQTFIEIYGAWDVKAISFKTLPDQCRQRGIVLWS